MHLTLTTLTLTLTLTLTEPNPKQGWCYNETLCAKRANSSLGTSKVVPEHGSCACMYYDASGNNENDCNCAHLYYCDGASFSGYREAPWPVKDSPNRFKQLMFRGLRNFDATLDYLVEKGMGKATELVVTGGSAGGLSTFLHTDRAALRVPAKAKVWL